MFPRESARKRIGGWPVSEALNPLFTPESSVYIEIPLGKSVEGGMRLMSDFEMLSLVLMVFMVVVPLVVELIKNTKK